MVLCGVVLLQQQLEIAMSEASNAAMSSQPSSPSSKSMEDKQMLQVKLNEKQSEVFKLQRSVDVKWCEFVW